MGLLRHFIGGIAAAKRTGPQPRQHTLVERSMRGDNEELRRLGGGRTRPVLPGLDTADRIDRKAVRAEQQPQLSRGVAAGPQIDRLRFTRFAADLSEFVADARIGIERRIVVVLHGEVSVEGTQGEPAAGSQCCCHSCDN